LGGGIGLGIVVGLAVLAKQPAVLFLGLLAFLAGFYAWRGERAVAKALLVGLVAALVISLPFYVRNALLFGSPFYPPVTSQAGQVLDTMNTRMFSAGPRTFYPAALQNAGPVLPWVLVGALVATPLRGRWDLRAGLLGLCIALVLAVPFVPRFEPRHLNPYDAAIALLSCLLLHDALRERPWLRLAVQTVLVGWAALFVARIPAFRSGIDTGPEAREAFRAIGREVPPGATVLSLWTYATFYYSRRNATWPIPWSPSANQLDLFVTNDPPRFLALLDRLAIEYLLVPKRAYPRYFNSADYPKSFVSCLVKARHAGQLRIAWESERYALIERVHATANASAAP
jgi:4-amino-4-deoxy-L-arabinose transferase-like glycosyltransferase